MRPRADAPPVPGEAPDALLVIATGCSHCAAELAALSELVKKGELGRLEVLNAAVRAEAAKALGVRGVPWLRLGPFELEGRRPAAELARWAERARAGEGAAEYLRELLGSGGLHAALRFVRGEPARLAALVSLIADPQTALEVRVGVGAVLESVAPGALRALVAPLGALTRHADARVRNDACHFLALTGAAQARRWVRPLLDDPDRDVREVARETLAALPGGDPRARPG